MKLITLFITIACLQVSAASFAQRVTLSEKNAPLSEVFNNIQRQSGYQFFYKGELLGNAKVSIDVKNVTVQQAMDVALKDLPLAYTITNSIIVIKAKDVVPEKTLAPASPKYVTGQVLDSKGVALSGASVSIKRTQTGTLTDVKGNFTLHEVLPTDVIRVTFIGYKPYEINVGDKTVFNIVMVETTNQLDQVVVQAYGNTSQRLATGNIGTVSAKEIENQPITNVLTAMEGKIPGLVIQQDNGYASAPFKVEIRGRTGLDPSRPSEPLYIIDGVPLTVLETGKAGQYSTGSAGFTQNGMTGPAGGQSPLFSLNPNDIESISVLKDADATAIYGSRGANGVIIITTKSGKAGKTKLDGMFYQGESFVTGHYDLLNEQQYLSMRKDAFYNDGVTPSLSNPSLSYDLLIWDPNRYTDYQKAFWGSTGHTTDAEAAVSGGDKLTTFRISGIYHSETPIMSTGSNQKTSVQFNLSHKSSNEKLNLTFTSTYSYADIGVVGVPSNLLLPPDAPPIFKLDGSPNWSGWEPQSNPFVSSLLQPYTSNTSFLNSHLLLTYELLKGLTISSSFGYSTTNQSQYYEYPIDSQDPAQNPTGSAQLGSNTNSNSIIEPQLEYKNFLGKGQLDVLLGGSSQEVNQNGHILVGNGYTNDLLIGSIANAPSTSATDVSLQYKYAALFGRINYDWDDKYIVNLTARRDGSSRFGPGKQFGNFGAVGAAWIFSGEEWVKNNLSFLSFGKIRGSFGITGSDDIPSYQYLSSWSSSSSSTYIPGVPSYKPTRLSNADLQWQVNKKLEAALDLGFIQDRITMEIAWYRDVSSNELIAAPLPTITGFTIVYENLPATIQNTGVESNFNAKIIDKKEFSWSVNFDIGINRNKLLAFPNLVNNQYKYLYVVGQSLSIVQLLHYTGVDPLTGQYTFEDKNHDGTISPYVSDPKNDLYATDLAVKYDGGFGTDFKYKNFNLSAFFRFRRQTIRSIYQGLGTPGSPGNIPLAYYQNAWQKPGDNAQFARLTTNPQNSDYNFYGYADATYVDGSYIRLQNLSISYQLSDLLVRKFGIRGCELFLRGENLFVLTKFSGLDPDASFGALPPSKILTIGLKFTL